MNHLTKKRRILSGSFIGIVLLTGFAIWQFYQFASFGGADTLFRSQGGTIHLWIALGLTIGACALGMLLFSVMVRHTADDDLHITSPPDLWRESKR